jgi:putative membrane protein
MPKEFRFVVTAAAAALALAGTAHAQSGSSPRTPPGYPQPKQPPGTSQQTPGTTPATPPGTSSPSGDASMPSGEHGAIHPKVSQWVQELGERNQGHIEAAKLAQEKASSPQVKELARKLQQDHSALEQPLQTYMRDRGRKVGEAPGFAKKAMEDMVSQLRSKQGNEFDRAYVQEEIRQHEYDVKLTKQMRDHTGGKDASFKKWLDDTENTMEGDLTAARQAKQALDGQRAAARRTPGSSGR